MAGSSIKEEEEVIQNKKNPNSLQICPEYDCCLYFKLWSSLGGPGSICLWLAVVFDGMLVSIWSSLLVSFRSRLNLFWLVLDVAVVLELR